MNRVISTLEITRSLRVHLVHDLFTQLPNEFWRRLASAGFGRIGYFAGPDDQPFRLGSPRLMLTAIRA